MNGNKSNNPHLEPDTFDIRASLRSLTDATRHHRMLVFLTCLMMLALVTLYIYVWPPIYTAEATIMSEPDYDYQRDTFYTGWDVFRKDASLTELQLITSGPVLADVVRKEKLTYDDVYHPFLAQVSYFWEKSALGRNYRKLKERIFPVPEEGRPTPEEMDFGRTVVGLAAGLKMEPVGESSVGKLNVKGPSRKVSKIANTLMEVYLERRIARHKEEAQSSYDILSEQVVKASKEMKALSDQRVGFSEQYGLTFDFQKEGLEVSKLTEWETGIANSQAKIAAEEASLRELEKQLETEPITSKVATTSEMNAFRESTKLKRLELQTALISLSGRYREDSPEVREIKNNITKLDALAAELSETVEKGTTEGLNMVRQDLISKGNSLRADLEGTRAGMAVMRETAAKMQTRLASMPALQNELQDMDRNLAAASEKYKQLLVKLGQAAVSLSTSGGTIQSVRVVDFAYPPGDKTWPKPKYLYPSALLVGLILGMGAAVIKSHTSGRILREHVEHGRGEVPLYGTIAVGTRRQPIFVAHRGTTAMPSSLESPVDTTAMPPSPESPKKDESFGAAGGTNRR